MRRSKREEIQLRETLYPALAQLIAENEESNECKNVPHTQTNIQRKILDHFPELEGVGCPLSANSQNITSISSYIINPNILSKSLSEWSPMDVIACDSDARHVGHSRGPGVQFVVYLTRDGSTGWAYVSGGEESPTRLSQLIRDFSTGIPGADKEFVWGTFSAIPDLQLKDFIPFYIRIAFVLILGCALGIRTGTYTILFGTAFDQGLRRGSSE